MINKIFRNNLSGLLQEAPLKQKIRKKTYNYTSFEFILLLFTLAITIMIFWESSYDWLSNLYVVQNDERQQIMPFLAYHQNTILQDSLIRNYMYEYVPMGPRIIYYIFTYFISPFLAAKAISLALFSFLLLYCYRIGKIITPTAGLLLAIMVVHGVPFASILGGIPRSFGVVLIFIFLFYFLKNNFTGVIITFFLQAAFYPSSLIICSTCYALYLLLQLVRFGIKSTYKSIFLSFLAMVICLLILSPVLNKPDFIGKLTTLEEASTMAVFFKGGRFEECLPFNPVTFDIAKAIVNAFQPVTSGFTSNAFVSWHGFVGMVLFWCITGTGCMILSGKWDMLIKFACFIAGGTMTYILAREIAFQLFLPVRLLQYSWTFLAPVICCLGLTSVPNFRIQNINIQIRTILIILFLSSFYLVSQYQTKEGANWNAFGFSDGRSNIPIYTFFSNTPKNSMVAGDPFELDNVMSFSRRKAYVTVEASHPLYKTYYSEIERRYNSFHKSYFSRNIHDIVKFIQEEKIDYLLVNREHFKTDYGINYKLFEPFTTQLEQSLQHIPAESFILNQTNVPGTVFSHGSFFIIDSKILLNETQAKNSQATRTQ